MKKIICVLLALAVVLSLSACSSNKPDKVVQLYLNGYLEMNCNMMQEAVLDQQDDIITMMQGDDSLEKKLIDIAREQMSYKITKTEYSDDKETAYVTVDITTKDLSQLLTQAISACYEWIFDQIINGGNASDAELYDKIYNYVLDSVKNINDTVTYTVKFVLTKDQDGNWKIDPQQYGKELINSLLANMFGSYWE